MEDLPWPSQPVPEPVKKLILRFYTSIDSHGPHASYKLASKVFTADGELIINKRIWSGSESICQWRAGGDTVIMRSHTIEEIFVCVSGRRYVFSRAESEEMADMDGRVYDKHLHIKPG
ncbi:hypothetical protein KC347_g156 [Hortaea werneckii]|nr:hypothetical protein KC347_g156 [Hortaea werneckii]